MSQFTRRVAAVGVAALALGLGAMGSVTATAAPTTPGSPPSYAPSWLALTTGTSNTVKLQTVDGTSATQTLRAGKGCSYSSSGATLLTLESHPESPGVGLAGGAFGVRESFTSSGTSCSAVDSVNGEVLSLDLGDDVGGLVAASASLDINLKQSAQILATAELDGVEVGWFELRSGTTITAPKPLPDGVVLTDSFTCNNPADSGPDSGTNNNCRWEVSAPSWTSIGEDGVVFDRLELKALNGSFSLMGGADGYADDPIDPLPGYFGASGPSVFELVEGVIDCGETVTLSGTAVQSSWKRLLNFGATSNTDCDPFPYSSRTGVDEDGRLFAEFTKPLDFETSAQALWTATFFVGAGNTVPPIRIELDQFGTTEKLVFDPVPMCPAEYFAESGAFVGPASEPLDPLACLVSAVRGTGKLGKYATYTAYVYGDATMRR